MKKHALGPARWKKRVLGRAPLFALLAAMAALSCAGDSDGNEDTAEAPSVGSAGPVETQGTAGLTDAEWRLVSLDLEDGESLIPEDSAVPTLTFLAESTPSGDMRFGGSGGCNRVHGEYRSEDDGRLSVTNSPAMTRMACPEAVMRLEHRLMMALESATSYEVEGGRLRIAFPGGTIRLVAGA